ncbi:MAG: hypothetical protein CVV39_05405 [Planctomycetes bacterium HGW-Planctomycetes-1]|nr:MAG: hypothetical protein CVV39_05405 [Planctomycetes bacterium HGW-Planctomycetes-1]
MRLVGVICGLLKPPFLSRERRLFCWFIRSAYNFASKLGVQKGDVRNEEKRSDVKEKEVKLKQ